MSILGEAVEITYIVQLVQSGKAHNYAPCDTFQAAIKKAKSLRKEVGNDKQILIVECRKVVIYDSEIARDLIGATNIK